MTKVKGVDVGPVSEATLMRFVDGDLPPREHAFVAELVAAYPEATGSVHAYRYTKDELPAAYDAAMHVPSELIGRWLPGVGAGSLVHWRHPRARLRVLALAASVAMLIAGAAGWLLREATNSNTTELLGLAPPELRQALETTLTGSVARLSGGLSARPVATFPSIDQRWCRQYAVSEGEQERMRGVACRNAAGWNILVQAASRQGPAPGGASGTAIPAAGGDDPVTAYRDQLLGGNVLTKADEARLIASERWGRAP
jgi:hypothetical protein